MKVQRIRTGNREIYRIKKHRDTKLIVYAFISGMAVLFILHNLFCC